MHRAIEGVVAIERPWPAARPGGKQRLIHSDHYISLDAVAQ
jgi:hypothetical protein